MPEIVTSMQFVSNTGTYIFDKNNLPLIGRRADYNRLTDQGQAGNRRINVTLNGFFDKNNHKEVVQEYQKLLEVIKCNDAKFTYKVDDVAIIDGLVYIDGYDEPVDWKQYTGDFSIGLHYFEKPNHLLSDLGILAVYAPEGAAPFKFDPVPHWAGSFKPTRPSVYGPRETPSGQKIGNEVAVTLTGRLADEDHSKLRIQVDALETALKKDGTLTYGAWTNKVYVDDFQIPSVFPRNYCDYQIVFRYATEDIIRFNSKRSISRLHNNPKITELPFCGTVRIQQFVPLGQTINYFFSLQAMSIEDARTALTNEMEAMIIPNGIELEGGKEDWDEGECSVTVSCSKYYFPPVIDNS